MTNQPAPSDTPRVDAFIIQAKQDHGDMWASQVPKIARLLELEIARLSAEREKERTADVEQHIQNVKAIERLATDNEELRATLAERDRQLAELKADCDAKVSACAEIVEECGRLRNERDDSQRQKAELLTVAQLAYRKHHLDDPDIGWNELGDKLCNALCNAMTDEGFKAWLKTVSHHE